MSRGRSREPTRAGRDTSAWPRAARCFWTKSARCPMRYRPCCCGCCRRTPTCPSAANGNGKRTCGSSRPRMRIYRKPSKMVVFGRTCTTGSASSRSGCRSFRSVPTTSCRSRSSFGSATRKSCGAKHAGSRRRPPNGCSPTHGRATYGSCRTRSSGRCCWPKAALSVWRTWDWMMPSRQATRIVRWPSGTRQARNAASSKP